MGNKRYYIDDLTWLADWGPNGHYYNDIRGHDKETGKRLGEWPKGREIRVYRERTIDRQCVDAVISGISESIDDIGLNLDIVDCDINPLVSSILRSVTVYCPETKRNGTKYPAHLELHNAYYTTLLGDLLFAGAYEFLRDETNGGKTHAVVVITDKALDGDRHAGIDGEAGFDKGYLIMSIPSPFKTRYRQIKKVGKHEAMHLLGFYEHHGDVEVEGFPAPANCITDVPIHTNKLCERDKMAIRYFWKVLEKEFGMKFLN